MTPENPSRSKPDAGREVFLAVVLATLVGGSATLFLIFVSGGFFAWVILIAAGIGVFGGLHYLLWGRAFTSEVGSNPTEAEDGDALESPAPTDTPWERRF